MREFIKNILILLFLVTIPSWCLASSITPNEIAKINNALTTRLDFDNYWFSKWKVEKERNLRIVPFNDKQYLVAFELLKGDWAKNNANQNWQITVVNLNGYSPLVYFPAIPYSMKELEIFLKQDMPDVQIGNFNLNKVHIKKIQKEGEYINSKIILQKAARQYNHGTEWELMVNALELQLSEIFEDKKYQTGVIIVHDIIISDESIYGIGVFNNGEHVENIIGIIHKNDSLMHKYFCDIRLEPLNSIDSKWLNKLLRKPLLWQLRCNNKCSIERTPVW